MTRHTFPRSEKLKSRKALEELFRVGKAFNVPPLRVVYRLGPPGAEAVQIGVGAPSKQFRRAVDRNRIKRLLREAYRLQKELLGEGRPVQFFVLYNGKDIPTFDVIHEKMGAVLTKLAHLRA